MLGDFGSNHGSPLLVGKKYHNLPNVGVGLWNQHFFEQVNALGNFSGSGFQQGDTL